MKKFCEFKKRRAQQLVEFLLVAPFIIIILGILTEYAYALNVNMTLTQGLKRVTSSMYYNTKPNQAKADIVSSVLMSLGAYLEDNNISTEASTHLTVTSLPLGNTTVFMASYTYVPAFTLPMLYFRFLPSQFNFLADSAVPTAFLNSNNYGTTINTSTLSNAWPAASAKGVVNDATVQSQMLFLVPTVAAGLAKPYQVKIWDGTVQPYTLNAADGKLYTCTATCVDSGKIFKTFYSAYSNIVFVHDSGVDGWGNILNRAVGLADSGALTRGNYDNMNVLLYNPGIVSGDTKYTVFAVVTQYGPKVFTYTGADDISALQ